MKTIATLISIIAFQLTTLAQTTAVTTESAAPAQVLSCSMAYSQELNNLSGTGPFKCREISISNLPPVTHSLTTMNLEFGMTGIFTFKKDAALEVYENQDVYIEDLLTGKVFDLKNSESYTFNVNRRVAERFILHIDKMMFKYSVSSK